MHEVLVRVIIETLGKRDTVGVLGVSIALGGIRWSRFLRRDRFGVLGSRSAG